MVGVPPFVLFLNCLFCLIFGEVKKRQRKEEKPMLVLLSPIEVQQTVKARGKVLLEHVSTHPSIYSFSASIYSPFLLQ